MGEAVHKLKIKKRTDYKALISHPYIVNNFIESGDADKSATLVLLDFDKAIMISL